MSINIGDNLLKNLEVGDDGVASLYVGDDKVWPADVLDATLSANKTSFLEGETISLTAQGLGGVLPYTNYDFRENGVSFQSGASSTASKVVGANGSSYTCVVTDTLTDTVTTNTIVVSVQPVVVPGSQTFTNSGTFVVPAGVTTIIVNAVGGGGGGGSGGKNTTEGIVGQIRTMGIGGGGGAAGSQYVGQPLSVTPGESLTITIGAGGSGGGFFTSSGGSLNGQAGSNGGTSTIKRGASTLLSASGGAGGAKGFVSGTEAPGWERPTPAQGGAKVNPSGSYFKGANGGGDSGTRGDQVNPPQYVDSQSEQGAGYVAVQAQGSSAFADTYDGGSYPEISTGVPSGAGGSSSWGIGGAGSPGRRNNNTAGNNGGGYGAGGGGGSGTIFLGSPGFNNYNRTGAPGGNGSKGRIQISWS